MQITVRLYWKLLPAHKRKRCLFKESCSRYVYRITTEKGLLAGLKALWKRIKQCRPGYKIYTLESGEEFIWLRDGTLVQLKDINRKPTINEFGSNI